MKAQHTISFWDITGGKPKFYDFSWDDSAIPLPAVGDKIWYEATALTVLKVENTYCRDGELRTMIEVERVDPSDSSIEWDF